MMFKKKSYTEKFKIDAVFQITDRGYSVKEVSIRLGISKKSLYDWIKQYKKPENQPLKESKQVGENRRLKSELARVTEERDILKKATATRIENKKFSQHKRVRNTLYIDQEFLPAESISQEEDERGYSQKGSVLWLTGLSGAGKTTLANHFERVLLDQSKLVYTLDGDKIRKGLSSDLGFSREDRCENIRRIGEVAQLFADAGVIVIVAFISPFRKDRDIVRKAMTKDSFVEVFVDSPLETCEKRDTKGLYKKAREGLIENFTGISSTYEPPLSPEIHLRTDKLTIDECVNEFSAYLDSHLPITCVSKYLSDPKFVDTLSDKT